MGRKQKHPEHKEKAAALMNELLDEIVAAWTAEKEPELKTIAEEIELSPAKLRKLLITAGERDKHTYYESPMATQIIRRKNEGKTVAEIQQIMGLSYTSVQGYLPHNRVYNLDTMSAECERIRLYRSRKKAKEELNSHLGLPDESVWLWRSVIAFENYPFKTAGRGGKGGVKFKYTVSRSGSAGGHHYDGEVVPGFGNELFIIRTGDDGKVEKQKSISRSTVDLALKKTREKEITGPKALGVPGAGSYLYAMFVRFGLIDHD